MYKARRRKLGSRLKYRTMSFTDRFIKVPVEIVKAGDDNLGTKEEVMCIEYMRINPLDIIGYRNRYSDEGRDNDKVVVEFKNRDNMIVCLSMEKFENLLNDLYKVTHAI